MGGETIRLDATCSCGATFSIEGGKYFYSVIKEEFSRFLEAHGKCLQKVEGPAITGSQKGDEIEMTQVVTPSDFHTIYEQTNRI